ncbi:hypothetical protein [Kibdelosporangium philippinense]|uniref:hypothetical protein n=1 Tax=Kibdelosporangium philippinense TaxID=211113 RepID=UPI003623417D
MLAGGQYDRSESRVILQRPDDRGAFDGLRPRAEDDSNLSRDVLPTADERDFLTRP